jgi:hypothetical protein
VNSNLVLPSNPMRPVRRPMPVCPLCAHQDHLVETAPGMFECGAHPGRLLLARVEADGFTSFAGELQEELLRCVGSGPGHRAGDGMVEYPVVEWRLSILARGLYRAVLDLYPHATMQAVPGGKSASWYIARFGLGILLSQRVLASVYGPGTGAFVWDYRISYWALPHQPTQLISWAEFAAREGLDPSFPYARLALEEG